MTRFTYQHLVELVDGDNELIARLVEEGEIERRRRRRRPSSIVDRVLVARTLFRELDVDWPGVEVILRSARLARGRAAPHRRARGRGRGGPAGPLRHRARPIVRAP